MNMYAKFQLHSPCGFSSEKIFEYFFENLPFMLPWQPIKFSYLDKVHMNHRGLLKNHFCKKNNLNICSETAKIANFHSSHYMSMETVTFHSNWVLIPLEQKTQLFSPPTYRCYMWNMESIGFTAWEEKSFENVDDRRMTGACLNYKLTCELRLRWATNTIIHSPGL